MKKLSVLLLFVIPLFVSAQLKTHWSPEQSMKMKNISAVQVSPDGSKVLYAVREAIMTDDRSEYVNQIFLSDAQGKNTVRLTRGDRNNANPKWSPDGQRIAFTSNRDGKNNIYILPVMGGESERLTDVKTGVADFQWSPDGKMIAYTMTDHATDAEEKAKKGKDDLYFIDENYKQGRLYILLLNEKDTTGKQKSLQLTKENRHIIDFNWSPDNKSIVFTHGSSSRVNDQVYSDISMVNISSGEVKKIAATGASESDAVFSPDGKSIAYFVSEDPVIWGGKTTVRILPLNGGKPVDLMGTPNEPSTMIGWSADGKYIYTGENHHTLIHIHKLSTDGKSVSVWNAGNNDLLTLVSLNETGTHFGFIMQNPSKPGDAYVSAVGSFSPVKISNVNPDLAGLPVPKTELITWKSFDGKVIEGLLTYPLNYEKGKKYPLILNIHGGPAGVFMQNFTAGNSGAYPIAAFAEQGIAVLRPNPRGSTGYGKDFRLANQRDWGGGDYQDLMLGVDHVINMGLADKEKLGVMGWSYGGFMSSWIVGHTDRFKAASIGAPVVDLASQNMTDDINGFLPSYMKKQPWEDWTVYEEHSPLRFVQNVKTPVLLQHGESDIRVPFSQGVMFYNALKRREVPVRFLVLPRQPHGPVEPKMTLKVMQTNLQWMKQYLTGGEKAF